ncbi:MAG: hypothetical protein KatS3mg010_1996 [Acidimicrobiia bacterium]|nr:MAG: hypothetical protein KatS3mg010_1996 [Acidimicrobiia bacterium]
MLDAAGWTDVEFTPHEVDMYVGGPGAVADAVETRMTIGPLADALAHAPDDVVAGGRRRAARRVREASRRCGGADARRVRDRHGAAPVTSAAGDATTGHGIARSAASATSKSRSSAWWRASTCMPTGSPSTKPAGMDTAGLP